MRYATIGMVNSCESARRKERRPAVGRHEASASRAIGGGRRRARGLEMQGRLVGR